MEFKLQQDMSWNINLDASISTSKACKRNVPIVQFCLICSPHYLDLRNCDMLSSRSQLIYFFSIWILKLRCNSNPWSSPVTMRVWLGQEQHKFRGRLNLHSNSDRVFSKNTTSVHSNPVHIDSVCITFFNCIFTWCSQSIQCHARICFEWKWWESLFGFY